MIVIACPDQGAGNDPEALGFSLLPSRPYIHYAHCQAAESSSSHYQPGFRKEVDDRIGISQFTKTSLQVM